MISPSASVYSCVSVTTSAAHQTPGGPGTRGTDSWLDDTDKKLIPIYLYCLNCTKFGQLILQKIIKIVKAVAMIFVRGDSPSPSLPLEVGPFNAARGSGGAL